MNTLTTKYANGNETIYQLINDGNDLPIAYHVETSQKVIEVMERARKNKSRVQIYYGDIATGKDWHEEHDTTGRIGLSRGRDARYPILVHNTRSYGGGAILDHCIVRIKIDGRVYYEQHNYQQPVLDVVPSDLPEYQYNVNINGELYSRHKTERAAKMLKTKLS